MFEAARKRVRRRYDEGAFEAVHDVLVHGDNPHKAGVRYGTSRRSVVALTRIFEQALALPRVPT